MLEARKRNRHLLCDEPKLERVFIQQTLHRVLWAEALVSGGGRGLLQGLGPRIADPRAPTVRHLVSVARFYPREYPLAVGVLGEITLNLGWLVEHWLAEQVLQWDHLQAVGHTQLAQWLALPPLPSTQTAVRAALDEAMSQWSLHFNLPLARRPAAV